MPSPLLIKTTFFSLTMPTAMRSVVLTSLFLVCASAWPQSIYVDLDVGIGDEGIGNGAPSSSFGGASGIPGYWNRIPIGGGVVWPLMNTSGLSTIATVSWTGSGGGIGYRNTSNTGDYSLLLNDAERVGTGGLTFTITGLQPGAYRAITYAVKPQGELWTTMISVPGSSSPNPQPVTGPMPGNQLILGITHCVHDIQLTGGNLVIQAAEHQNSYVNGFQLVAVPEPSAVFACAFGLAALAALRRRRM